MFLFSRKRLKNDSVMGESSNKSMEHGSITMNDNIKRVLELINDNPDLPVVCMVDGDVVRDDWGRWMAQIGWSDVGEYALYNERFYDDREEFTEDYYIHNDETLDERFGYDVRMSYLDASMFNEDAIKANEEAEKRLNAYLDEVANKAFTKAIIVYIDTPDDIEEFEDEKIQNI